MIVPKCSPRVVRPHDQWRFGEGRKEVRVKVSGDRTSDDADAVRRWAVEAKGLAYKSWLDVAGDVRAGRLKVLFADLLGEPTPLNLICAHRAQLSKPVHLLREFVQARCAELQRDASLDESGRGAAITFGGVAVGQIRPQRRARRDEGLPVGGIGQ